VTDEDRLASDGARLEKLRKRVGLTRREVADRIGVKQPTVWAWEKGKARPRAEKLARLAEILRCSVIDIVPDVPRRRARAA
jgi:transcriptional regulator with XRE-family HTH domain